MYAWKSSGLINNKVTGIGRLCPHHAPGTCEKISAHSAVRKQCSPTVPTGACAPPMIDADRPVVPSAKKCTGCGRPATYPQIVSPTPAGCMSTAMHCEVPGEGGGACVWARAWAFAWALLLPLLLLPLPPLLPTLLLLDSAAMMRSLSAQTASPASGTSAAEGWRTCSATTSSPGPASCSAAASARYDAGVPSTAATNDTRALLPRPRSPSSPPVGMANFGVGTTMLVVQHDVSRPRAVRPITVEPRCWQRSTPWLGACRGGVLGGVPWVHVHERDGGGGVRGGCKLRDQLCESICTLHTIANIVSCWPTHPAEPRR